MNCKPGDLCIVIRSRYGNEGREVTVLRWLREGQWDPDLGGCCAEAAAWLVRARWPLRAPDDEYDSPPLFGLFLDSDLLPLRPPAEPRADVEREPINADQGIAHG